MKRTPAYLLPFFQQGDLYSAALDRERMVVIDNQLDDLARIIGDGVLSGWTVCHSGTNEIEISPGVGFINGIVHKTLSIKKKIVLSDISTSVYMQSQILGASGGLKVETESPASDMVSISYTDTVPPAAPSDFVSIAADYNVINLFWDANTEQDMDHYELWRSTLVGGPFVLIASPIENGVSPDDPYQDTDLAASTAYYYRIYAVDKSGNTSSASTANATTLPDTRKPAEPNAFRVFPSNTTVSMIWNASQTTGVKYRLTIQALNIDGSTAGSPQVFDDLTVLYWQIISLTNGQRYRVTLQAKALTGILSDGMTSDFTPTSSVAPLDPILDTSDASAAVTSLTAAIQLNWLASPSSTGTAISQKKEYWIRVGKDGVESAPIKLIGLALSKTILSFSPQLAIGEGLPQSLVDNTSYSLRITTLDAVGHESAGMVLKGSILDTTSPNDPRFLQLVAGDTVVNAFWKHSSSQDVVGYVININTGSGYGPDIELGYLTKYAISGLTNNVLITVRVRSIDGAGNLSAGITASATPVPDTTAPAVPTYLRAMGEDQQVVIQWRANSETDLSHYVLKRMATAQNLLAITGKDLTEVTEIQKSIVVGNVTTSISTGSVTSDDLAGLPDLTGYVYVSISGVLNGRKSVIASHNPTNGQVTFATAFSQPLAVGSQFSVRPTHPSLGTLTRNVGTAVDILDIGLLNGQTYAYYVQAVDIRGNASAFAGPVLVSPNCGLNDINPPENLSAGFSSGIVTLTWSQVVPTADHPATDHTAFNIYRSTSQISGFVLIESVPSDVLTATDGNLINGLTYYYIVTAVRDTADVVIDTGAIAPSNTVQLATVKIDSSTPLGCEITAIQNQQRLLERLDATISEETSDRLLAHRHLTKPLNSIEIEATPLLAVIDVSTLADFDFTGMDHDETTAQYYKDLITSPVTGKAIPYDAGTTYVISPSSIVAGMPYVGDFQVLVDGAMPTVEFAIDQTRNAILFSDPLKQVSVVTLDGGGLSFYVPARIDLGSRGFNVLVNGSESLTPSIDEALQTVRYLEALKDTDVVTVVIEPVIPDFGTQQGARQISLSPNIVLSDFSTKNRILYESESGVFDSSDSFFVLVDGERTTQTHSIDASAKTITFDTALPSGSVVALEILNREEVQGVLPAAKIEGVEASQFKSGAFLPAQLPSISHSGRIKERALPFFQTLSSDNKYIFNAPAGIVGSATTPYSMHRYSEDVLFLGTSNGLLKTDDFSSFIGEGQAAEATIDYSIKPPGGLKFESAAADAILTKARAAKKLSGRFNGSVTIQMLVDGTPTPVREIQGPNLIELDNGTVLISGGAAYNQTLSTYLEVGDSYIHDPDTGVASQVGSLVFRRRDHSAVLLPTGNVLICGGSVLSIVHVNPTDGTPDVVDTIRLGTAEIFDIAANTWAQTGTMLQTRDFHAFVLLDSSTVLAAGGTTGVSSYDGVSRPALTTQPTTLVEAEIYNISAGTWAQSASMSRPRVNAEIKADGGIAIVTGGGQDGRELFATGTWILEGAATETEQNSFEEEFGVSSLDGPVKQFFKDSTGTLFLVTRNKVYSTTDGEVFLETRGLEAVGVVHRVAQGDDGTLFAATDLGVYEIGPDLRDQFTWFQGGLIGQGTTETFDLQAYSGTMLAATEIGIFSSSDGGENWLQLSSLEDVFNIELIDTTLFANSGRDLYRSDTGGATWTFISTLSFVDADSRMISRTPFDIFFSTGTGLYASRDGISFFLVDFNQNRQTAINNVHMAEILGTDLLVGYDNKVISIGPEFEILLLAEFVGSIPTVLVNDEEVRDGFRYDVENNQVVFEKKRGVTDVVKASSNYGLYKPVNGPWYHQKANASVTVYVNGKIQDDSSIAFDPRSGQITFDENLKKHDVVTVSIAGTSILDGGELFHDELEDRLELEKGLPLSLGRDHAGNILQLGLGVEHNFLERGIERNQYYCSQQSLVDRSFTSFMQNSEFYIMGRREFDRFNSTIDYDLESEQTDIGQRALMPLSALEVASDLWVGTENGIFILDPTASIPFSISETIKIGDGNAIRDMKYLLGDIWLATQFGIYVTEDAGTIFFKNDGHGLPSTILKLSQIGNILLAGTSDAIYYSDGLNQDPEYSIWFRASFVEAGTIQPYLANGACNAIATGDGIAYAAIGSSLFLTIDGKTWQHIYDFDKTIKISSLTVFAKSLFVGTNAGIYSDDGSARSDSPVFKVEFIETTEAASLTLAVNDMFVHTDGNATSLYVVGESEKVYALTNGIWTNTSISGSVAIHRFIILSGPKQVAMSNDTVYAQ